MEIEDVKTKLNNKASRIRTSNNGLENRPRKYQNFVSVLASIFPFQIQFFQSKQKFVYFQSFDEFFHCFQ